MAVTNSGMTNYTTNNTQETWSGSDDLDSEVSKDGGGSESWLVAKNGNETTAISKVVNLGTPKYFNFWMKSDWGAFYTQIDASLLDGTSTNLFTVATGGKHGTPNLNPEISGDFKPSVLQIDQGSTPAYVPANHTSMSINVDASSTGNIRSIVNHWIDTMWYGNGRIISGTPVAGNVFLESHELDVSNADYDGCSFLFDSGLAYYTDVTDSSASTSTNGSVVFYAKATTDGTLALNVSGASTYEGMSFVTEGTTDLDFIPTNAGFSMSGGQISGGGSDTLVTGQAFSGTVFNNRTDSTIGATMTNCVWNTCGQITLTGTLSGGTINTPTAPLSTTSTNNVGSCSFVSGGTGYAVELGTISANVSMTWSALCTSYAGSNGSTGNEMLHINVANGFTVTITQSAPLTYHKEGTGTLTILTNPVSIDINVKDQAAANVVGALVYVDEDLGAAGSIINTTSDATGDVATSYSGAASSAAVRVRKYGFKPYVGTISLLADSTTNVTMITDPQQT